MGSKLVIQEDAYEFDVVVVGAGIIGLAIADQLSGRYKNILLVEKERTLGQHTSSRNSGVIHSGIYYPKNSLKASLCLKGNQLLYGFLKKYNIPHKNCGKLIVATDAKEANELELIYQKGIANNVPDLQFFNSRQIEDLQPGIKACRAIHVPSAGIVDAHSLMHQIRKNIVQKDVVMLYNNRVSDIKHNDDIYKVFFDGKDFCAKTKIVINAAGLWSDQISQMVGIKDYKLEWHKGEYYKTNKYRRNMKCLIYPLPDKNSLGIHTVIDMDGGISFGPNAYSTNKIDYNVDDSHQQEFCDKINKYLDISYDDLWIDSSGIRPKIKQKKGFRDFVISNEKDKGYENFINLIGIESPGLTCCFSIAEYVENIIENEA